MVEAGAGAASPVAERRFAALAGWRIGQALAHAGLAAVMGRARATFNVDPVALVAAEAAVGDFDPLRRAPARDSGQRTMLGEALRARGWSVRRSPANGLPVEFGTDAAFGQGALLAAGLASRPMAGHGRPDRPRITVGSGNAGLLAALDASR